MEQVTFGSLFAGIGGFDLGFERAGFQCRWQVEIDDYATKILEKHWPKVHRQRDIRECNASNLEQVDCIIGGFPCQDISYAGRGAGLAGERSGLFFEAIRLVRELQPRAVVLENVAALLTRGLDKVLGTLAEVGYDAQWHCIPAAAVGAPHIRDRVFVIAYSMRNSYCIDDNSKQARNQQDTIASGVGCGSHQGKSPDVANADSERLSEAGCSKGGCGSSGCCSSRSNANIASMERQRAIAIGASEKLRDACNGGWWSTEPAVGRVANGIPNRVDRLRCLGNAIVPQVAEVVARMTLELLQQDAALWSRDSR